LVPVQKPIIVNSPNNPSRGAVYPEELIASIVNPLRKQGILYDLDDIYHKLVFDGKVAVPAYQYTAKDLENSKFIVINWCGKIIWNDRFP